MNGKVMGFYLSEQSPVMIQSRNQIACILEYLTVVTTNMNNPQSRNHVKITSRDLFL